MSAFGPSRWHLRRTNGRGNSFQLFFPVARFNHPSVLGLTRIRSAHWLAEVNVVIRKSDAARQFAASSWLGVGSHDKQMTRARASFPRQPMRVRMALSTSASSRSDQREEKRQAWFVCCGDAFSSVLRLLWNLPIARSGRERACHWKRSHLVAKPRRHLPFDPAVTTSPNTTGRCRIAPNENKMSDGGRGRAWVGMGLWKSSQKVERTAVRRSLHRLVRRFG